MNAVNPAQTMRNLSHFCLSREGRQTSFSTKIRSLFLIILSALVFTLLAFSQGTYREITGVISDTKCVKNHKISASLSANACVNACVTAGANFALIAGDKVYVLEGQNPELKEFAGQEATVYGAVIDKKSASRR